MGAGIDVALVVAPRLVSALPAAVRCVRVDDVYSRHIKIITHLCQVPLPEVCCVLMGSVQ